MTEDKLNKSRMKIATFLKNKRLKMKISQEELATKCNSTVGTISRMENGHFWLVMKQYVLICEALEIDYLKIFEDEND
jgi:transcriptional regulator with XRE-family HTH domain